MVINSIYPLLIGDSKNWGRGNGEMNSFLIWYFIPPAHRMYTYTYFVNQAFLTVYIEYPMAKILSFEFPFTI